MHLQSKLQQQNSANCCMYLQYVQKSIYINRSGKYDLEVYSQQLFTLSLSISCGDTFASYMLWIILKTWQISLMIILIRQNLEMKCPPSNQFQPV